MQHSHPAYQHSHPVDLRCNESQWYAVYVTPRHEKKVGEYLTIRQVENFVPLYETETRWKDGSRAILRLPLFQGYLFVRPTESEWRSVLSVPGVVSVLGKREKLGVSAHYVTALQQCLSERKVTPHPYLLEGVRVRIIRGPMPGFEGIVVKVKGRLRVVIKLELLRKSIAVEVDADAVEVIGAKKSPVPIEIAAFESVQLAKGA